ncbi:MAG: beta-propeller domain-containing protein, partial [Aquihabitans sp.]
MNDPIDFNSPGEDDDPVLSDAGDRLRHDSASISPAAVEAAVWRRRTKRMGILAGASLAVVALFGGLLVMKNDSTPGDEAAAPKPGAPSTGDVQKLLASLDDQPVDPTKVQLVSTVSTFSDCGGLMGDLRRVGAEHVGSRGFGGFSYGMPMVEVGAAMDRASTDFAPVGEKLDGALPSSSDPAGMANTGSDEGSTLGTNVQVAGVDELDFVKAVDDLIFDLDGNGNLRITDASELKVLATLDVTPGKDGDDEDGRLGPGGGTQVSQILVADGRVAIFGTEYEISEPVEGDPSATQASTAFMTVTFVDARDPAKPAITDRVRVEGSLVSARLVGDDIRLVTTSDMADLGFVMPTTPTSVAKALEQNRRSVAASTAADWVPDWQRKGEDPQPLVPCERVHVPDT